MAHVNRFNHTSGMVVVTPYDRRKSVRNRCVIEVFGVFFCVVALLFGFFCGCRGFYDRTESDLFLFLLTSEQSSFKDGLYASVYFKLSIDSFSTE